MNQDGGGYHDHQEAAQKLLRGVNAANSQFVITEVALKTSWEAKPDGEEWERQENAFFHHARSVLQAMTTAQSIDSRACPWMQTSEKIRKSDSSVSRRFRGSIKQIPQGMVVGTFLIPCVV